MALRLASDPIFLSALLIPAALATFIIFGSYAEFTPQWLTERPKAIFWYVLLLPVIEELAFRGWLQGLLIKKTPEIQLPVPGLTIANLLTSAAFCALHMIQSLSLWAAATFIPSLVFGFFRDRYQSVVPGTFLHVIYNAGFLLLTF